MNSKSLRQYWNKGSASMPFDKDHSRYAESVLAEITRPCAICDLGGGTGADTIYFLTKGHKVTEYDISEVGLERTREKAEKLGLEGNLELVQADFGSHNFSLPENKFDLVFSRLAVHYFTPDVTAKIFHEVYKGLKQGGVAKLTLKSPSDKDEMDFLSNNAEEINPGVFEENGMIKSRYTIKQLAEILEKAEIPARQFSVKEITEDMSGRTDKVKSGNQKFILNEITIKK